MLKCVAPVSTGRDVTGEIRIGPADRRAVRCVVPGGVYSRPGECADDMRGG